MAAQTYNFPDHINGDTFPGVEFTYVVNTLPLSLSGATIKMSLKKDKDGQGSVIDLSTVTGEIVITDAAAGIFQVKEQVIQVAKADVYYYDIQVTLQDGSIKTYVEGTWTILQDVTQ